MAEGGRPAKRPKVEVEPAGAAAAADDPGAAESAAAGPAADPPVEQPRLWESAPDWLRTHKDGKWGKYAGKFEGVSGEELCEMTEEQIKSIVGNIAHGIALFNDIAKLKKPATSSSSESSPGSAAGRADMGRLVAGLRSFKSDGLEPGSVLTLPAATVGEGEGGKVLYIREEYVTALEMWEQQRKDVGGMLLVIGTPGIGKSLFGRLVFTLEMAKGETVLWIAGEDKRLFRDDRIINIRTVSEIGDKHGSLYADVIIVYDTVVGLHKFFGDQSLVFKCVLALHSPSAQIGSTEKQMSGNAATLVMNPITLPEMLDIRSKIERADPSVAAKMGDDAAVQRKFAVCGGSLRYILLTHEEMIGKIAEAEAKLSGEVLTTAVGGSLAESGGRLCHRILHMWRNDVSRRRFILRFCSDTVKDSVLDTVSSQRVADLLSLANRVDVNGSLRGQVWENRVHSMFCERKGMSFESRELVPVASAAGVGSAAASSTVTIPAMFDSFVFNKIDDFACKVGVYYRPKSSNFETVDSFFVFNDGSNLVAVLVQATVSTSHSVKLAGLQSVLASIKGGVGMVDKKLLVFLTPPAAFEKFGPHRQEITIKGGAAAANQNIVQQHVWSVREFDGSPVWRHQ
eukprot:CAMPEP_0182916828 /NCGR_PEP_ID=MMETSP0105_2-20130417/1165_1 /TAXON_ID=81532 ORGANISM="Acanthoeca-like sp., Strain 10tr" /NCGR_SAMPLE_ID=MMETSP0105_2 /ASSEMBLY_ACC=CAM_ASM_000205 /LENGTH=625 /DNA_ID=CAMNT_0025053795 /DNA_START=151 /DNA_END=2028 /DNA_ORIENTATION=-